MISPKTMRESFSFHHIGKRQYQEDFLYIDPDNRLFIICDGVGGSMNGDLASKIVVKSIVDQYKYFQGNVSIQTIENFIQNAAKKLNQLAESDEDFEGMATTLALLYLEGSRAIIAHLGDSRIYYIRNQKDWTATKDHSVVRELYDAGVLKSELEMHKHPFKNRITKALRANLSGEMVNPEIKMVKNIYSDQYFILCSDGAMENYLSQELVDHFTNPLIPFESRWKSFELICSDNSSDNNTCIVVKT